jgi:hypothetical protein
MPQAPSFPYLVKDYDSRSVDSCKDICRKIGNVSEGVKKSLCAALTRKDRVRSDWEMLSEKPWTCLREAASAKAGRHLYTMKSQGSLAEESSIALSPLVTVTFQIPACQGFGDSLSRSWAGLPNPRPPRGCKGRSSNHSRVTDIEPRKHRGSFYRCGFSPSKNFASRVVPDFTAWSAC